MPLETITYTSDLDPTNPPASDGLVQGDDHIRGIKAALKNTFPNFTAAALTATQAEVATAVSQSKGTQAHLVPAGTVAAPGLTPIGDTDTGLYAPAANELALAVGGLKAVHVHSDKSIELPGALNVTGAITGPGAVPVGGTIQWWDDTLPTEGGWGWANGGTLSRTGSPILFARWGTRFGAGDGSTTFNVPDMRECVPQGKSQMGGVAARGLHVLGVYTTAAINLIGGVIGEAVHLLTTGEMPSHTHTATVTDPGHSHVVHGTVVSNLNNGSTFSAINALSGSTTGVTDNSATGISVTNSATGSGTAHNNLQPTVICNFIIRIG
jgi:microcystin-dependent protein